MARYVALLRGINVGGRNLIRMPDLKACFEANGFGDVATYIQSGNVLFDAPGPAKDLAAAVERMLDDAFDYRARVVIRSARQMRSIVERAPKGFGTRPGEYRYDVLFLRPPLTPAATLEQVSLKEGVDAVYPGTGVVYFSRLEARATQSRLNRVASLPIYQDMTIRNWNTTVKLDALLNARA